jgi:hypothetical protein
MNTQRPNTTPEIRIDFEEYPWGSSDHAFTQLAIAYDLSEDAIDEFTPEERLFWAAAATAVASCHAIGPNGEVDILDGSAIESLFTAADSSDVDSTHFLHEFAAHCKLLFRGRRHTKEGAETLLSVALATFKPE